MSTTATAAPTNDATARLLRHINARRRKRGWAWLVLAAAGAGAATFGALAWGYPAQFPGLVPAAQVGVFQSLVAGMGLVVLAAGAIIARQMARAQWAPKAAFVAYKMDETAYRLYLGLQYELESLGQMGRAWRVAGQSALGAPQARHGLRLRVAPLADVKVQLPVRGLGLPWLSLFFLPTQILILQRGRYQSIGYAGLTASAVHEPNPNGGEGQGRLTVKSGSTLLLDILVSNFDVARDLVTALVRYREYLAAPKPPEPPPSPPPPPAAEREPYRQYARADTYRAEAGPRRQVPPPPRPPLPATPVPDPYEVLGIKPGATRKEITAAYRVMAKLYHPDHTLALGPEVRAAAERRMQEINAAYATLKP